jgi:hypothetical protein
VRRSAASAKEIKTGSGSLRTAKTRGHITIKLFNCKAVLESIEQKP